MRPLLLCISLLLLGAPRLLADAGCEHAPPTATATAVEGGQVSPTLDTRQLAPPASHCPAPVPGRCCTALSGCGAGLEAAAPAMARPPLLEIAGANRGFLNALVSRTASLEPPPPRA